MRKSEKEELIESLIHAGFTMCADSKKPGAVVERLPKEMREKLKELTSDDFKNFRCN